MEIQDIEISAITSNPDLMMRERLDDGLVAQYKENLETIIAAAPLEVYRVDGRYILTDGFHRIAAARELEWEAISVKIFEGSFQDAYAAACLANLQHGKPLTRQERKKAICEYIKLKVKESNVLIAKVTGVADVTVGKYRSELEAKGEIEPQETRKGADGKSYKSQTAPAISPSKNLEGEETEDTIDPFDTWFSEHVICGDTLEIMPTIERKFDLAIIDPPYGITTEEWDLSDPHELITFTKRWLGHVSRLLKPTGRLYVFWSREYMFELKPLLDAITEAYPLAFGGIIVWHMTNVQSMPNNRKQYKLSWEPVFYYYGLKADELNFPKTEVTGKSWKGKGEIQSDVWSFPIPQSNFKKDKRIHPTQKPLELYRRIIETATHVGDAVIDPFAGSGTTGHAALLTGREFLLVEKKPGYVQLINERLRPIWSGPGLQG